MSERNEIPLTLKDREDIDVILVDYVTIGADTSTSGKEEVTNLDLFRRRGKMLALPDLRRWMDVQVLVVVKAVPGTAKKKDLATQICPK